jgi:hypothetical protein
VAARLRLAVSSERRVFAEGAKPVAGPALGTPPQCQVSDDVLESMGRPLFAIHGAFTEIQLAFTLTERQIKTFD